MGILLDSTSTLLCCNVIGIRVFTKLLIYVNYVLEIFNQYHEFHIFQVL